MPDQLRSLVDRFGHARSGLILVVGVLAVVAIWGITRWSTAGAQVPLLPGLGIDGIAEVTAKLDEHGVPYRLAKGGSEILVDEAELARARVLLARDGLPSKGRPGFELFDRPSWGMTDFTQRINYRRALEGELERTISQMRGVEAAQVHLAISQSTAFRRSENPQAASVVLRLRSGARPGAEVVDGVASLVASSVDGLESDNVTVLDDAGRLLSAAIEPGNAAGLTKRQLGLRREVESYLEAKAEELVASVVGAGNTRVSVAADLNFDRIERTTQTVDPDATIALQEERSEIVPGEGQTGAGSTAEKNTYDTSRTVEQYSGAAGSIQRLTVAVLLNDRTGQTEGVPALTPQQLTHIEGLVRNAVGLDPQRGDDITIVSIPFDAVASPIDPIADGPGIMQQLPEYQRPFVTVIALILAFILALKALRAVKTVAPSQTVPVPALEGGQAAALESVDTALKTAPRKLPESEHARTLARSAETPETAARVLRAWMKES